MPSLDCDGISLQKCLANSGKLILFVVNLLYANCKWSHYEKKQYHYAMDIDYFCCKMKVKDQVRELGI